MQNRELRAAHVQLEESRARLADLYDFAPVVYVTLDAEARIVEANLTAASYFGVERGNLVGKSLTGFAPMSDRGPLRQHVQRCFAERIRVESELSFSVRGRPAVTAQMVSVPLFDRGRRRDRLQDDAHRHHDAQAHAGEAAIPVAGEHDPGVVLRLPGEPRQGRPRGRPGAGRHLRDRPGRRRRPGLAAGDGVRRPVERASGWTRSGRPRRVPTRRRRWVG